MANLMSLYVNGERTLAPYDPDLLSFEHEGTHIHMPLSSPCSRFWVNGEIYGFKPYHTGGGCMAMRKDLPNGDYLLLTTSDGIHIPDKPEDAADAILGRYVSDGEAIAYITLSDIPEPGEE